MFGAFVLTNSLSSPSSRCSGDAVPRESAPAVWSQLLIHSSGTLRTVCLQLRSPGTEHGKLKKIIKSWRTGRLRDLHLAITLLHLALVTIVARSWLCESLVFAVFYLPLDRIMTALADLVDGHRIQRLNAVTFVVQVILECCRVLMLLRPLPLTVTSSSAHLFFYLNFPAAQNVFLFKSSKHDFEVNLISNNSVCLSLKIENPLNFH